jgi:hypothetical protein
MEVSLETCEQPQEGASATSRVSSLNNESNFLPLGTYENRHAEYVHVQSELKQKINHLKFNLNLVSTVCLFHYYFTILGENKLCINVSRFFKSAYVNSTPLYIYIYKNIFKLLRGTLLH